MPVPRRIVRLAVTALFVLYPFAVWFTLTRHGTRIAALLVLSMALLSVLGRKSRGREGVAMIAAQAGGVAAIAMLTMVFDEPLFLLQTPVLISLFLLASFAWTLFRPPTMIERYALMIRRDLLPGESGYCRTVTYVWIAFFIVNAAVAEGLALWASTETWALYAGGIAYGLIGAVFSVEYVVRTVRFRRFGKGPVDRILARIIAGRSGATDTTGRN